MQKVNWNLEKSCIVVEEKLKGKSINLKLMHQKINAEERHFALVS